MRGECGGHPRGHHGHHGRHAGPGRGFGGEWGWEGFGGAMGGRGGGRGRRMFDGSELRLVLLKLIADQPRHGYDLIREIEEITGGGYTPSPGMIYPTLTLLDDTGLIAEQQAEGAKKLYAVTDEGRAHLEEHAEEVEALIARLTRLGEKSRSSQGHGVRRAMMNLGMALRNRYMAGDFDDETLRKLVDLIDETAKKVERL
nr:PadR family transcriptional regulator [Hephaestia mangrovi]